MVKPRFTLSEISANIPPPQCSKHGIAKRMDKYIAIRMCDNCFCTANMDSAQHKAIAVDESVHIVAMSNPDVTHRAPVSGYSNWSIILTWPANYTRLSA
jgi:hypothetical protein